MFKKNSDLEQIKQIYNSSSKKYISPESNNTAIQDKGMASYLYYEDGSNLALGYITVYENSDFIQKEEFEVKIDGIKKDSVYIWEIGTRKGYEGKGIATRMLQYVLKQYPGRDIYSCIDVENIASLKVHKKEGFVNIENFVGNFFSEQDEHYVIMGRIN